MIFLDFETRSTVDLTVHGGRRYAAGDTEILCGVALDTRTDPATVYVWSPFPGPLDRARGRDWRLEASYLRKLNTPPEAVVYAEPLLDSDDPPEPILAAARAGVPFVAHNAYGFDEHVWNGLGLPAADWRDSLVLSRRRGLPGKLDQLGKTLYGLGKDKAGRQVMLALSTPLTKGRCACGRKRRECPACPPVFLEPSDGRLTSVVRYCLRDVMLMTAVCLDEGLLEAHPDDAVLAAHRAIDERGVRVDLKTAGEILDASNAHVGAVVAQAGVAPEVLSSPVQLMEWLGKHDCPVPNVQKATLESVTAPNDQVRRVIDARLALARVTSGKILAIRNRVCPDGRLRGILAYHGAHTGRWAGRGFQPQNLPRPVKGLSTDIFDDPSEVPAVAERESVDASSVFGSMLRGVLVPAIPYKFAIFDYSQIEARVLLWLAGDDEGLEVFRLADAGRGPDPYCAFGERLFGEPIGEDDPRRQVAKAAVLGAGYQCGGVRLGEYARSMGADLEAAGITGDDLVEAWRDAHASVAGVWDGRSRFQTEDGRWVRVRRGGLWKEYKRAAWDAVNDSFGGAHTAGRCRFQRQGRHLTVTLPSGRALIYREARLEDVPAKWGGTTRALTFQDHHGNRTATYGGKLTENIDQAVGRDLLADALVRLEAAGLRPVFHVHDEVVCEVMTEEAGADVGRIMSTAPAWAEGLPLSADGKLAERYGK